LLLKRQRWPKTSLVLPPASRTKRSPAAQSQALSL